MVYTGRRNLKMKYDEIDLCIAGVLMWVAEEERWQEFGWRESVRRGLELVEFLTFVRDANPSSSGNEGDGV